MRRRWPCRCTWTRSFLSACGAPIPLRAPARGNVADYWTALEGVSHFLYLAWNAGHDKPVSLLELEMQAEIDKYVASLRSCAGSSGALPRRAAATALRAHAHRSEVWLRGREQHVPLGEPLCGKFCRRLERALRASRGAFTGEVLAELRRFYRLSDGRKLAHIERGA